MKEFSAEIAVARNGVPVGSILLFGEVLRSGRCCLTTTDMGKHYRCEEFDFFTALQSLRREFELQGLQLLCQGSRETVWPSRMGREMGLGLKAYLCQPGKPAKKLVPIFDPAPLDECTTVEEQEQYQEQWRLSLPN